MAVFDETLFTLAPAMYRALDGACRAQRDGGPAGPAPVAPAFLRFGSWVGADRDGNPLVTAQVTREAAVIQADHALRALENATSRIGRALTVHAEAAPPGAGLTLALEAAETDHPELLAGLAGRSPQEPYRTYLLYLAVAASHARTTPPGPAAAYLIGRSPFSMGRTGRWAKSVDLGANGYLISICAQGRLRGETGKKPRARSRRLRRRSWSR